MVLCLWVLLWRVLQSYSLLSALINIYYLSFRNNKKCQVQEEQQKTGKQLGVVDKMTSEQQIHESMPLLWMCDICGD